ncbi:hypothetical protein [Achromobacter pestifer]|uniref:Lipoprotein 15 n=1 Tax=Achromobacter pestifer TaxID=1353889 RepID=A0A6S7AXI9_9BURK|nr:hypothetical protein [Achromobacter pestifer]CAB3707719.1 hypothetical protein LMG3431_05804 [Achromobacter pestifer]
MTKPALLLALAIVLAGCSKEESPWTRLQAATPQLKVTANTPDAAVKSWWHVRDEEERYAVAVCKELAELYRPLRSARDSVSTEGLQANLAGNEKCDQESYDREIVNVDVQSNTRALVVAHIRNSKPPTPGYVMNIDERDKKERGVRMQYLLERADNTQAWKVAQVYDQHRYCTVTPVNGWCPLYNQSPGSGHTYVLESAQ